MIGYILALALYAIGFIGLFTMATDLNEGPIRTGRARLAIVFWPITILYGFVGDIVDGYWRRR